MRKKSKLWDELKTQPLRLKQRLAEAGRSQGWLAAELTKRGYKIARPTIWGLINKGYIPGGRLGRKGAVPEDSNRGASIQKTIEEILTDNKIATTGIWLPLPGAERKMWGIRAQDSYRHRTLRNNTPPAPLDRGENGGFPSSKRGLRGVSYLLKEMEMNYTKSYLEEDVLRHFGLESDPFYDVLDFTDIWVSPRLRVIEKRVADTIRRHGIMAIIGDIGAGKTTFLRYFLSKMLKEKTVKIIYPDRMDRKMLNGSALTQAVITQLGGQRIPRSAVERDALSKRLLEENVRMGTNPLLVLDEAHDLREEAYIALKRIWDSGMIFKLLSIVLVGQGGSDNQNNSYGLKDRLENNPFIREFAERCYVVDMGSLNGSMAQYLDFRFKKAGGDIHKVFGDKALSMLSKRADVPQLANNIAIRAMNNAWRDGKRTVEAQHVAEA